MTISQAHIFTLAPILVSPTISTRSTLETIKDAYHRIRFFIGGKRQDYTNLLPLIFGLIVGRLSKPNCHSVVPHKLQDLEKLHENLRNNMISTCYTAARYHIAQLFLPLLSATKILLKMKEQKEYRPIIYQKNDIDKNVYAHC